MAEKRNRWLLQIVLLMAVFSLVGVSILPVISEAIAQGPATAVGEAASTNSLSAARRSELEAQAKGYELVLQREPDNKTALEGLADTRMELREMASAISPLQRLAKLNPEETRYSVLLAQVQQYVGDREGAAQTYRGLLGSRPGDLDALKGLVGLLLDQDRPEAAIGLLQDTLKKAPQANQVQADAIDVSSVQLILGQVYATQKRYAEAVAIYDEAIKADRQDFRPVLSKALVLQQQGQSEEAGPLFITAAALAPTQYRDEINRLAAAKPVPPATKAIEPTKPASLPQPDGVKPSTSEAAEPAKPESSKPELGSN